MAERNQLPNSPSDSPIIKGDTGDAVKILQSFLESQAIDDLLPDRNFTLLDEKHFGTFDEDTRKALQAWQAANEDSIKKAGNLQDLQKELGKLGYPTWQVISRELNRNKNLPSVQSPTESPLQDPKGSNKIKNATHYVRTKNSQSRLALREKPSFVEVSKDSWKDLDKKGELVMMLDNDVVLKIVNPHLGYECQWHQVEVLDPDPKWDKAKKRQEEIPLYVFGEFCQPLSFTPEMLPINCVDCKEVSSGESFKEWFKRDKCEPFKQDCNYCTVVETSDTRTTNSLLPQQKKRALRTGVEQLLSFYNKINDSTFINRLMSAFEFAHIPENGWYLNERPNSKLKFLVKIPAKYFDAIPEKKDTLDDLSVVEGQLPRDWRTTHFTTNSLRGNIEKVVNRMREYALEIDKWDGTLLDYNIREEIARLQAFPAVLREFVEINGYEYRETEEDTIEIGFEGPCFNLIYVLINQGARSTPLRVGLECFKKKDPIVFQKTMGYVFYLDDIVRNISQKKWIEFIQEYTCPIPQISPSKKSSSIQNRRNTSNKKDERIIERVDATSVKTTKEKETEDGLINDIDFKKRITNTREGESEFIGDSVLSCETIPETLSRINSLEDVYSEILNKIDISEVAALASSFIASKMDPTDVNQSICRAIFEEKTLVELDELIENLPAPYSEELPSKIQNSLESEPQGSNNTSVNIKREQILKIVPEQILCSTIAVVDALQISDLKEKMNVSSRSSEDIVRNLPNIPSVLLPDNLPTEDTMSEIIPSIENAIKGALSGSLITVVKEIFTILCALTRDNTQPEALENFGDSNINDIIRDSFPSNLGRTGILDSNDIGGEVLRDFGVANGIIGNGGIETFGPLVSDFFDDISFVLTPSEICRLLDGTPSDEVLSIVSGLLQNKYSQLLDFIEGVGKIKQFFSYLGNFVDPKVCEEIESKSKCIPKELCNTDENNNLRRSLLSDKMSPEQVQSQVERLKEEQRRQLKQLAKIVQGDILKNALASIAPDSCPADGAPAIVPQDPQSLEFLNDKIIGVMFDGVHMSFNSDAVEYPTSLIESQRVQNESELKESNEEFKRAHAAKLEQINSLNEEQTEALLKDPVADGTGRGERGNIVAPEIQSLLSDIENFRHVENDVFSSKSQYLYQVTLTNVLERLEDIRRQFFKDQPDKELVFRKILNELNKPGGFEASNIADQIGTVRSEQKKVDDRRKEIDAQRKLEKTAARESFKELPDPICLPEAPELDELISQLRDFANENFVEDKKVIEYINPVYDGNKVDLKDEFVLKIHDSTLENPIFISKSEEIPADVSEIIKNYKLSTEGNPSAKQEVFSEFVKRKWDSVVTKETSQSKFSKGTVFHKFFRDATYHRITNYFMSLFALQTRNSRLFEIDNLQALELVPPQLDDDESLCAPVVTKDRSILDIDDIKRRVREDYDKRLSLCSEVDLEEDPSLFMSEIEKAGMGGVVQIITRLFIVDIMLRGLFVWSEFKLSDTLSDNVISDFIVDKVKIDLRAMGDDFYDRFAIQAREYLKFRGDKLFDPSAEDPTNLKEEERFINEQDPQFQSGESAVEYLIKEQIKPISQKLELILGEEKVEDLEKIFLDKWVSQTDGIIGNSFSARRYLERQGLQNIGGFFLERYVRVCEDNSANGIVKAPDSTVGKGEKISYGVRLTYISPVNSKNKEGEDPYKDIEFRDIQSIKDEKSYKIFGETRLIPDRGSLIPVQDPDIWAFPLVEIEEDTVRIGKSTEEQEKEIYESLKDNLRRTAEWKLMFHYCFPLKRLLALNAIYNIVSMGVIMKQVNSAFIRTKYSLKSLQHTLLPTTDGRPWWNKPSPDIEGLGGNLGIRAERMNNITTDGTTPDLLKLAQATIGIIVKGMAEKYDPSYKLIKQLDDRGAALGGLTWRSVPQVLPVNIFGVFGFGPPLGQWGALALSTPLLSGERKANKRRKMEFENSQGKECEEDEQ